MPIYALGDRVPAIDPAAYVHPEATIIGDVTVGSGSSVWPGTVLRGDYGRIEVGSDTSVQDGAVIHATAELATVIGSRVVIGHLAHLEGCVVDDHALIGVGASVLHRALVGEGATVGAGAVVTNGQVVPPRALAVGVPAAIKPDRSDPDLIDLAAQVYVENSHRYATELRRLD
ncbi:MAG: gamma carbonic anhydrase family protein [Actinomycetota bacterium]|nr:gamma carbonic anhydrase family protein [Actinomycetota bacterium]